MAVGIKCNAYKKMLKNVTEDQLKTKVMSGLSWARISFPIELNPIYIVFDKKPTAEEICSLLKSNFDINEKYNITWSIK